MYLSIITDEVSQDPERAAEFAVAHGVEWVAVRSAWGKNVMQLADEDLEALAAVFKRFDLRVSSVLSPLFKCHLPGSVENELVDPHFVGFPPIYTEHHAQARRLPDIAARLGAPVIRIFTFLTDGPESGVLSEERLRVIGSAVSGWRDVRPAIENEFVCHVRTLPELEAACSATGIAAVLDLCNHDVATGDDGLDDITPSLVRSAADVHVKDWDGTQYLPAGQGRLRWPDILGRLRELGYRGPVTLESHLRGNLDGVAESIRALRHWGVR